ncbi:hypothetical protein P168DRAFT_268151 [Aspergillus campestris IBT 28561]|uniref:Endonuclease III homolog n=1 Tax=Aspergillus campestris (strain IBT 28561) TaxID=1392248 RepID=A0A2I1D5J4_ASPC2|nr:uncharacterized protein P168DRAFT_268151 [Aspergillus campestris IBT 28561]PKY05147.1 hypothetical protein P168DRAFT_268151 [Aspergillus campestris IBT 28561]
MRTSRTSQDTAKLVQALSPPARTRSALRSFALGAPVPAGRFDHALSDDESSLSSVNTVDIEDIVEPPAKKRKAAVDSAAKAAKVVTAAKSQQIGRTTIKDEPETKVQKARRTPARKLKSPDGSYHMEPPSNWETIYSTVKKMREENPTAPVDTMGCAELYWRASSPRDRRYHILTALMLSSQTKDTVTAVAMHRLHTELGQDSAEVTVKSEDSDEVKVKSEYPDELAVKPEDSKDSKDSTLNLKNILAVPPERLNQLIGTVGFHNNKTKYIKATALILRDQHNSDIPSTPEGLMKLPGVGPKMAYLCMSAAWGKHLGIGVDVHVHRITNLWGWHKTKNPEETRMALESWLPHDKWHEINKLLVGLGQTVCLPVGRRCGECDLAGTKLCKSEVKGPVTKGKKTRTTRITFLDLPEHVQIRIFRYAWLLRPCLLDLRYEKHRTVCQTGNIQCNRFHGFLPPGRMPWLIVRHIDCRHPRLPTQLFAVSRAMREQAGAIFFRRNRFNIKLDTVAQFRLFRSAMEWGVHHIRSLHVDMGPAYNRYLGLGIGIHSRVMKTWTKFCRAAAEGMPSLRLFSLKCRVREFEVACKMMVAMDPFPLLFNCAIHMMTSVDDDIRRVIKRAAWRVTGNLPDNMPVFPYLRLPKEIQLMVLENLLTDRSDPYLAVADSEDGIVTFQDRRNDRRIVFPLTCCENCSPVGAMCFCHSRQTSFSTSCTCFSSPLPYFLVSRGFYEDARRIFFSKNHFAFLEEDPEFMMRLWHYIPTPSFMHIRQLSFKFPLSYRMPYRPGKLVDHSTLLPWLILLRFIREHFDLPRLSLTIVDLGTKNAFAGNTTEYRIKFMRKLLKSFVELRGLRDFRVYLADDRMYEHIAEGAVLGRRSRFRHDFPFVV